MSPCLGERLHSNLRSLYPHIAKVSKYLRYILTSCSNPCKTTFKFHTMLPCLIICISSKVSYNSHYVLHIAPSPHKWLIIKFLAFGTQWVNLNLHWKYEWNQDIFQRSSDRNLEHMHHSHRLSHYYPILVTFMILHELN